MCWKDKSVYSIHENWRVLKMKADRQTKNYENSL